MVEVKTLEKDYPKSDHGRLCLRINYAYGCALSLLINLY